MNFTSTKIAFINAHPSKDGVDLLGRRLAKFIRLTEDYKEYKNQKDDVIKHGNDNHESKNRQRKLK